MLSLIDQLTSVTLQPLKSYARNPISEPHKQILISVQIYFIGIDSINKNTSFRRMTTQGVESKLLSNIKVDTRIRK